MEEKSILLFGAGFKNGLQTVRYLEKIEEYPEPEEVEGDYYSMGFHDGVDYGKYLAMTYQRYDVSDEKVLSAIENYLNNRITTERIK